MKNFHIYISSCAMLLCALCVSCVKEEEYINTKKGNFESLWKQMDEHYCFFDYKKQQLGIDWNEVHSRYSSMINEKMTSNQLFEVLCNMIGELHDGHVNISAAFDFGRNWSYFEDFPANYNDSIIHATYIKTNYSIASGLYYRILEDNIGYVKCESFSTPIGDGNVSLMLNELANCNGIIIDVRDNGGGNLTNARTLASHFTNEKILTGYVCHKTGKGHSDFSEPQPLYLEPSSSGLRWQKKCVVLTNRSSFSATNDFVMNMKYCPNVTILGDKTGGGSGMPFTSELPNGWSIRYSAVITYDAEMHHTEFGIEPDISVQMSGSDTQRHLDTLIEEARNLINNPK